MRIGLIYLGRHGPGGLISLELASYLSRKADLFAVVSQNADHIEHWRSSGLKIIDVPTFDTRSQAFASSLRRAPIRELAARISSLRPDVLLYPMVHPWTPALQKYLAGIPDVTAVHDPAPHPGFIHRLSSFWESRSAKRATRCIVLGNTFVNDMRRKGIPEEKIDVIPHPVFSFYDRYTPQTSNTARPRSLLFFGRITQYKGLDVLLRAFRILEAQLPDLRLQIIGEGDIRSYQPLIDGVRNVTVTNQWVSDASVPDIFQAADIVVVPYISASQSGVIALAASFRRPVIATRVGAIPEQIRDRDTGLLVDPGSPEALAEAITNMINDDNLRETVARNLADEMRRKCNWNVTSDAYLESCRKAVLSRGSRR
jgi:starch synthase